MDMQLGSIMGATEARRAMEKYWSDEPESENASGLVRRAVTAAVRGFASAARKTRTTGTVTEPSPAPAGGD